MMKKLKTQIVVQSHFKLVVAGDPRFAKYRDRIMVDLRYATLRTATEFAEAVIASQSDDFAHQVDPDSTRIGGHIHIAAVTPDGFRWIIPPGKPDQR